MCVDEARSHRATVKIDHLGPAVCERAHVAARHSAAKRDSPSMATLASTVMTVPLTRIRSADV